MKRILSILSVITSMATLSTASFASESVIPEPLAKIPYIQFVYVDALLSSGYSSIAVVSDRDMPSLLQWGGSFTAGARLFNGKLIAGLTSGYSWANQYSTVVASVGNQRGGRWNVIAPVVGTTYGPFTAKLDFQFLGSYALATPTPQGDELSYNRPLGGRLTALYQLPLPFIPFQLPGHGVNAGVHLEMLRFSRAELSSGEAFALANAALYWQAGLSLGYVF